MRVHPDCFPCFLRQVVIALRLVTDDEPLQHAILKDVLEDIRSADLSKPPAYATTFIHRKVRSALGVDPFKQIKSKYNRIALELYPTLREITQMSSDPLHTAARLAIAGNVIDFGIFSSIDIDGSIRKALDHPLAYDEYEAFQSTVATSREILFLADNAGEIVFDRLLIETLISRGKQVRVVVKGAPVINDATREDAFESGLNGICEVLDNGSDCVGTIIEWTSDSFQNAFNSADLVISKGQANFETLTGKAKTIFFLFQSKCKVVSEELGLQTGSMLLKRF